jgi:SpoVK/Ycf46/Vps4 family AAA+-type ATPase
LAAVELLSTPMAVLLGGMPGCGKSLCAKAMAGELRWPLLRLDVGRIFGGLLGQSEENMETALSLAEEMRPVVMWLDEIEKGFGRVQGPSANGTALRVFQRFLTWLQERSGCVFVVATANEYHELPAELFRAGRFDERFFIDLPNIDERCLLMEHFLEQNGRTVAEHDLNELAAQTGGYSGADLVGRIVNAFYDAGKEHRLNPTPEELQNALTAEPRPLAVNQKDQFQKMRDSWLEFARPA